MGSGKIPGSPSTMPNRTSLIFPFRGAADTYDAQERAVFAQGLSGGHAVGTVVSLRLLAGILSLVGTVLMVGALVALLRVTDWNSDRFRGALRENRTITAAGLIGFGLDVTGAAVRLLA